MRRVATIAVDRAVQSPDHPTWVVRPPRPWLRLLFTVERSTTSRNRRFILTAGSSSF